jgi:hypothetical protein
MHRRCLALLLMAALLVPQTARAWNDTGHMLVAEIAYQRLSPSAKARVEALVAIQAEPENSTFVTASCWADDLKRYDVHAYDTWHYIDMPFSPDNTPLPPLPKDENVVWAMKQCISTLHNPRVPDVEKARMLRFLIHFVGDVHQPLHCVSRYTQQHPSGDRGGNDFKLQGIPGVTNLHAYWDDGIGLFTHVARPLAADDTTLKTLADAIVADFPPDSLPEWKDSTFTDWVSEGENLARTLCYDLPENAPPPADYIARARPAARKRIALAGYRLADLLNQLFQDNTNHPLR